MNVRVSMCVRVSVCLCEDKTRQDRTRTLRLPRLDTRRVIAGTVQPGVSIL